MPHPGQLLSLDFYQPFLVDALRIGFILLFAYAATAVSKRVIRALRKYSVRVMAKAGGASEYELEKRADTIGGVVRKTLVTLIWATALLMILYELRFDVRPLLAGASVVGVAFGFGAQGLVKDVIAGLFLLIENQVRVNDVAVINGKGGLVEEINLRTTVLRDEAGAVHIFPNGGIQSLSNLTREFSYAVFSVSVSYKEDTDRVIAVLKRIGEEILLEDPYRNAILAPLEVMGVDHLGESCVAIKARFKTLPIQQWTVGREMNRRIKKRFEEAGIAIPFPTQTFQLSPEVPLQLQQELRRIVREALDESRPA